MVENKFVQVLYSFLRAEKQTINQRNLALQLLSHPDFPSFRAITDTFDHFRIPAVAAKIPPEMLDKLPANFITLVKNGSTQEIGWVKQAAGYIYLKTPNGTQKKLTKEAFLLNWEGNIIAIDQEEHFSGNSRRFFQKGWLAFFLLSFLGVLSTVLSNDWPATGMILTALPGIAVSYLVVSKSLGVSHAITSKICETTSSGISDNCETVTQSAYGRLFGSVSLGDLALIYFVSVFIVTILSGYNQLFFTILAIGNLIFVGYSWIAQFFLIKKLCALCLLIGFIALLQTGIAAYSFSSAVFNSIDVVYFVKAAFVFSFVIVGWTTLKKYIRQEIRSNHLEEDYLKFKRKKGLFQLLLSQQPVIQSTLPEPYILTYGKKDAHLVITVVLNPLCGYCGEAFKSYNNLLETYGEQIRLDLVFSVPPPGKRNPATAIANHTIHLYGENPLLAWEFLKKWFDDRDIYLDEIQELTKQMEEQNPGDFEVLANQAKWLQMNHINSTPQMLIGHRFYPSEYETGDLPGIMEDLLNEDFS